jgi:ubiquinone/menaquinone biosynthesis C-methylase UbiE
MSVFDSAENVARYEAWFKKHRAVFESEVAAIKEILPYGTGFEIGIGTGLFAEKLGIRMGNDPSQAMLELAHKRQRLVYNCSGDTLPFHDGYFDFMLMVTTICFLDNPEEVLLECRRVVKPYGAVVIGFVDSESPLGKSYQNRAARSVFYREAKFYSVQQVNTMLDDAGFRVDAVRQTLFGKLKAIAGMQPSREGWGQGAFVVVRAIRR